ncbi:MAG: helix-turn-helix domain-containing protein, partial [Deltaproteobacteria bacterium]|nr:helix-turn-helix domain-containing protein [Deltaproteobacteria bacterium]
MTFGEFADFLRLHPAMRLHSSTIYRLLRQGKLRAFKVGSDWCFSREA